MATEREKEPVQIENPFTSHYLYPQHWKAILTQIGEPKDEIEQQIVQVGIYAQTGRYSPLTGFHIQEYLGWRHLNRINMIVPESEKVLRGLKRFIAPKPDPVKAQILEDAIRFAGSLMAVTWTLDDHIEISTRGLGNPHPFRHSCTEMFWNEEHHMWVGYVHENIYLNRELSSDKDFVPVPRYLERDQLEYEIRHRWLLTEPGELVDPIHTSQKRLDEILRKHDQINHDVILARLIRNRKMFYEANAKAHPPELSSPFFGRREKQIYMATGF